MPGHRKGWSGDGIIAQHALLAGTPESPALVFRALGANGIALDRHQRALFVSNTDQGSILRIALGSSHSARLAETELSCT